LRTGRARNQTFLSPVRLCIRRLSTAVVIALVFDALSLIALEEAVVLDRSLIELADLPPGWCAWRADRTSPWQRAPETAEDDAADSGE
jgi:hypothetical protein